MSEGQKMRLTAVFMSYVGLLMLTGGLVLVWDQGWGLVTGAVLVLCRSGTLLDRFTPKPAKAAAKAAGPGERSLV